MKDEDYLAHRGLVLRLAYDITGSWADAQDVAQQVWVRWHSVEGEVRSPRAYLARMATTAALDVVERRERVGYPGPFLPEPVPTGPGADEALELAEEIEIALMLVLDRLSPLERAAFLLHDVFGFSHPEVADTLGREPAAVRQLASRARRRVAAERSAAASAAVDPAELRALTEVFLAAARAGDVAALRRHLREDAVFVGDGGGRARTALRPIEGADRVARLLVALFERLGAGLELRWVTANRRPALAFVEGARLDTLAWVLLDGARVSGVYVVRNPDKLATLSGHRAR